MMFPMIISKGDSIRNSCWKTTENTKQLISLNPTHCCKMRDIVVDYINHVDTGGWSEISQKKINGPVETGREIKNCEMQKQ